MHAVYGVARRRRSRSRPPGARTSRSPAGRCSARASRRVRIEERFGALRAATVDAYSRLVPDDLSATSRRASPRCWSAWPGATTWRLSLVTGNLEPIARMKLKAAGLEHYFPAGQGGFGSDSRGPHRPAGDRAPARGPARDEPYPRGRTLRDRRHAARHRLRARRRRARRRDRHRARSRPPIWATPTPWWTTRRPSASNWIACWPEVAYARCMRVGILTGGGDCPGLNGVIRAVVRARARLRRRRRRLPRRLARPDRGRHDAAAAGGRPRHPPRGGTILGSSRTNPFKHDDGVDRIRETLIERSLDGLIAIGGEDTLGAAAKLHAERGAARRRRAQDDRQRPRRHRPDLRLRHGGAGRHRGDRPPAHHGRVAPARDDPRGDGPPRRLDRAALRASPAAPT